MRILITGQLSLHWGRMENGNIGNYYIVEPLIRELHRVFPQAELVTTMQMTEAFQQRENIKTIPMELYYGWKDDDLEIAKNEYLIAKKINETGILQKTTPYIDEILKSDLVIDFSGDMWGENADVIAPNRFLVGLYKDRTAQLLNKKCALFLVSPGPFNKQFEDFAKEVYSNFDLVVLREPESFKLLKKWQFNLTKTETCACQSVLFEPAKENEIQKFIIDTPLKNPTKPIIGFTICGWNMLKGPFSREDFGDEEYSNFIDLIGFCCKELNAKVCLISHSNGFELPPNFKLKKGRDYKLLSQIFNIIQKTSFKDDVFLFDKIYLPNETKAIISKFDMLISGRVHGAIAGLSSCVPTVIIDYGHEPKAHKLKGFAELYKVTDYIANPHDIDDMTAKTQYCFNKRDFIRDELKQTVEQVKTLAREATEKIKDIL